MEFSLLLDSFSFINFVDKYHILDDWLEDFIYMDGKYITLNPFEKRLLIYDIGISDKLKETEFTKETLLISEAKKMSLYLLHRIRFMKYLSTL